MKRIAALAALAALAVPATAEACKPMANPPTQVTVKTKRVVHNGPYCAPHYRTIRVVVHAEGRTVVITIRVPVRSHVAQPRMSR